MMALEQNPAYEPVAFLSLTRNAERLTLNAIEESSNKLLKKLIRDLNSKALSVRR